MALLVLNACSQNEGPEVLGPGELWVSVEGADNVTKTSLSASDGKTTFVSGDRIKVFDSAGKSTVYRFQTLLEDKAKFLEVTSERQAGFDITAFKAAFYPAASVKSFNKDNVSITASISNQQTYATGSFGNGAAPMASNIYDSTNKLIKFKNCFGVVRLGFHNDTPSVPLTIKSISLTSAATNLSGSMTFTVTGTNEISVSAGSGSNRTVVLNSCETAGALGTDTAYFYVALPGISGTADGEKISVEVTPAKGIPFGGYFMASKTSPSATNTVSKNNLLKLAAFRIRAINAFDSYSIVDWNSDTVTVGQITVAESSYKIGTGASSIDVQINGATDIEKLSLTVKSGHFIASKNSESGKIYVTISKTSGWISGETGVILVNDEVTNSGVYINVKIQD